MKRNLFIVLAVVLGLMGCASETEQAAMDQVSQVFGPITNMSKGVATSTEEGKSGKYFDIEITNPDFFREGVDLTEVAGGAACILYKNFSEEEREKYNRYSLVLKDTLNHEIEFTLSTEIVKRYCEQEKIAVLYLDQLMKGDFKYINDQYTEQRRIGADSLAISFDPLLKRNGAYKAIEVYTVKPEEYAFADGSKKEALCFSGSIIKENGPVRFRFWLDPETNSQNIISIQYEKE